MAETEKQSIRRETVQKVSELITVAFGLIAALAWNTAIQEWFKTQTWLAAYGPWAYAVVVTVIAVVATIWIGRIKGKVESK